MGLEWKNWSGSVRFHPDDIQTPENDEALASLVRRAGEQGRVVRVVGAGHSSSPLVETSELLVSLEKFKGLESHDNAAGEAVLRAGMTVHEAGSTLLEHGLALHNTGDVDVQTLEGAIGTGTHGTGAKLQNLSSMLIGVRMVNARGEIVECHEQSDPKTLRALRVSLGSLGIFTALRVRVLPAFQLERREWCSQIDDCRPHIDQLIAENRNFDFYWYPRSDEAKLRTLNPPGQGTTHLPFATVQKQYTGWSNEVLPRHRELRFEEMEYALPAENALACFDEVRQRVKACWRRIVGWRVLYRTIAADDAYLSPYHGRESVTISLHQNVGLPFWEYFKDIEPIFRAYSGRPHWGKKHTLIAKDLRSIYPKWEQFQSLRRESDPDGRFLNPYLRELFEETA
jgi:FAD/FMN-containing dehydrogenase